MSVREYVHAAFARDADGFPIQPPAGALLAADGTGTGIWNPSPAVSSGELTLITNASPVTPAAGNLGVYTDGTKLRYIDSGSNSFVVATATDLADYLSRYGGLMLGSIFMNGNGITNIGWNTFNANPGPVTAPAGGLSLYTNLNKLRYMDSTNAAFVVATTADLGSYLPLAGGTMTGPINMGSQSITGCTALRMTATGNSVLVGDATSAINTGNNCTVVGPSGANSNNSINTTVVGPAASATTANNAIVIGSGTYAAGAVSATVVGSGSAAVTGTNIIILGPASTGNAGAGGSIIIGGLSNSTAASAHCFGNALNNSVAGSLLLDATANMRPSVTASCDIGTTTNRFRSLYLSADVNATRVFSGGNSVSVLRCSLTDTTAGFSASTAETSIIQGPLLGSLTVPAPTAAGFTVKFSSNWLLSCGTATTFTIRLKVNGTTIMTHVYSLAAVANLDIAHEMTVQLRTPSNRLYTASRLMPHGLSSNLIASIADSIWNTAAANTFSLTGQFGNTTCSWRGDSFDMWSS